MIQYATNFLMMRSYLTVLTALSCTVFCNADVNNYAYNNQERVAPGTGKRRFDDADWEISKAMGIRDKNIDNVVVSPLSLKVVLATLLDAANGTTANELANFLQINTNNKQDSRMYFYELLKSLKTTDSIVSDVETRIFAHNTASLNETFLRGIKEFYGTDVESVDFSQLSDVIKKINSWAKIATHGHIRDLISEADTDKNAVMLLMNIIYFNGLWALPFNTNETRSEPFFVNANQNINVKMMKSQQVLEYTETSDYDLQMVRLPYMGGKFAMYFLLPFNKNGLDELMNTITPGRVHSLMQTMRPTTVNLSIPRFEFLYSVGLKTVLENLGVRTMFTTNADFSNMENGTHNLFVSNILQKAGIEVNEKGSIAYAATEVNIQNKFGDEQAIDFTANRPFLFFIEEDKSRTVVFVGKVTNPTADLELPPSLPNKIDSGSTALITEKTNENDEVLNSSQLAEKELQTYFDTELLLNLGSTNSQKNIFLSPASIKSVLGLLWEAAEGKTASELEMVMHLTKNATVARERLHTIQLALKAMTDKFSMKTANAMFLSDKAKVKAEYKTVAENKYFAAVQPVNFQTPATAAKIINDWVNRKTGGFVPTFITPDKIQQDTQMVLVNAMVFKATWLYNFQPTATKVQEFYVSETEKMFTYMMNIKGIFKHSYEPTLGASVVQIPFKDEKYNFIIVLPKEKDGLHQVSRAIIHNPLISILLNQDQQEVALSLPRFKIESEFELSEPLSAIGAKTIFSDIAELPNIIEGNTTLKVSTMLHKAVIDVNEEGVTAAAATGAAVVPLMSPYTVNFIADHPFLFFIYNSKSNILIFEGRLNKPQEASKDKFKHIPLQHPTSDPKLIIPPNYQQSTAFRTTNEQPVRTGTYQSQSPVINYYQPGSATADRDAVKFMKY
ncbi:uncharacterized protein LOC142327294 [Lycorma delicatula]|uniref:uncharacterized protein LOC142327294 n=1 Tax=Lycorma delicatula TaxID=130591 RepID=UPI003F519DFC